jgi:hypothetical protein
MRWLKRALVNSKWLNAVIHRVNDQHVYYNHVVTFSSELVRFSRSKFGTPTCMHHFDKMTSVTPVLKQPQTIPVCCISERIEFVTTYIVLDPSDKVYFAYFFFRFFTQYKTVMHTYNILRYTFKEE